MSFKSKPHAEAAPWRFVPATVPDWEPSREQARWLVLDRSSARRFEVGRAAAESAERCLRSIGTCFGLDLADDPVHEVNCGRRAWMVLFDRHLLGADAVAQLATRKATLAIVASRSEQTGAYAAAYVVDATPGDVDGEVRLSVFRTTGRLAFGGIARIDGTCASFALHAASRPGAFAIELAGRFESGKLVVDTSLASAGIVVPKRHPVADRRSPDDTAMSATP